MKVCELIDFLNRKISEGKIRRDSEVLCTSDENVGLYEYKPSMINLVCINGDRFAEFMKEDLHHDLEYWERQYARHENDERKDYCGIKYLKLKDNISKLNAEWRDAIVI